MSVKTYAPTELVLAGRSRFVPLLCSTTEASGMIAPVVSCTVPLMAACACARVVRGWRRQRVAANSANHANARNLEIGQEFLDVIVASPSRKRVPKERLVSPGRFNRSKKDPKTDSKTP